LTIIINNNSHRHWVSNLEEKRLYSHRNLADLKFALLQKLQRFADLVKILCRFEVHPFTKTATLRKSRKNPFYKNYIDLQIS